jgi:hypothetical protein
MKHVSVVLCFALLLVTTGCASITGTSVQPVSVTAVCDGSKVVKDALCTLSNDKGQWFITSPGSTMIQKSFGDLAITCKKGDSTGVAVVKSNSNSNVWGNVLAGGVIGYAVDATSGAGFNYQNMLVVSMSAPCVIN